MRRPMMSQPLMISGLLQHADKNHGDTEAGPRLPSGKTHRYTCHEAHRRSCQLARALLAIGVKVGDCTGTLAWNIHRHLFSWR